MDNIYNTSFDVGVAVKEETAAAVAPKSSKKKKRRKRKRSGSTSSFDGFPLPPPLTVDDDDVRTAGKPAETVTPNNRTDEKSESTVATSETTGKKKKKKKRRRKQKNDSGISNADDISTNESKAPSAIAEQGEKQPNSPERCKTSDVDISMPSAGKKKRKKKKKRKNSVTEDGASTASPMKTDVGEIIQQTKSTSVPKQGPLKGMFIKERSNLPVFQHRDEICNLVSKNDVLLVVAETVC